MKRKPQIIKAAAPTVIPPVKAEVIKGKKAAAAVTAAPPKVEPSTDRRITVGARVDEWRIVRSQRKAHVGWWLQAGHFEEQAGRQLFRVAQQTLYPDLAQAKAALAAKLPKPAAA